MDLILSASSNGSTSGRNCVTVFDEQLPYSHEVIHGAIVPLMVGLFCTCITWALFGVQLFRIAHYTTFRSHTWLGRHILILLLFPVVTTCHLLAAFVPRSMIFCQFVANAYIAVVLVVFFFQVISYFGGEEEMLMQMKETYVVQPFCCSCTWSFCQQKFHRKRLSRFRKLTLQYSVVQPATGFLGSVFAADGNFTPGALRFDNAYIYLQVISVVSLLLCLPSLMRLNLTTQQFINKRFRSAAKFYAIWLVLLLTNAQLLVFSIMGGAGAWHCSEIWALPTLSAWYQHFAVVYEVCVLSVFVHVYAFPADISLDKPSSHDITSLDCSAAGIAEEQPLLTPEQTPSVNL